MAINICRCSQNHCVRASPESFSSAHRLQVVVKHNYAVNRGNAFAYNRAFEYTAENSLSNNWDSSGCRARPRKHIRRIHSYNSYRRPFCYPPVPKIRKAFTFLFGISVPILRQELFRSFVVLLTVILYFQFICCRIWKYML